MSYELNGGGHGINDPPSPFAMVMVSVVWCCHCHRVDMKTSQPLLFIFLKIPLGEKELKYRNT